MSGKPEKIGVLLIEDDPMVQEVNRQFIEQVQGFEVIGIGSDGAKGLALAKEKRPDLVLLDIFMPEQDGIAVLQQFRTGSIDVDVIVVTAANDGETIRKMLQNGAVDYIIKPFTFDRLKKSLENYRLYVEQFSGEEAVSQQQIDRWLSANAAGDEEGETVIVEEAEDLPKGLNRQTLKQVMLFLMNQDKSVSAEETAQAIGIARVTARRYLDYFEKIGKVELDIQYGGVGRPVNRYQLQV
nr:response regulator [Bacillus marinisedimentorum]